MWVGWSSGETIKVIIYRFLYRLCGWVGLVMRLSRLLYTGCYIDYMITITRIIAPVKG